MNLPVIKLSDWNYGRTRGFIKKRTLKKDIERGVKFLSEFGYSDKWGGTKTSALFFQQVAKYISLDSVYRADFIFNNKNWYTLRLFTKDGYTIQLKGMSFGYWGEGSRGSLAVLKACGFSDKQINKIFVFDNSDKKSFKLFRRVV